MKKNITVQINSKTINIILILIVLLLYIFNNMYIKANTSGHIHKFFICHFNDLICPLLYLSLVNILFYSINKEIVKLPLILCLGGYASIVWEFIAPIINTNSVSDILDLYFYMLGAFLYWLILTIHSKYPYKRTFEF